MPGTPQLSPLLSKVLPALGAQACLALRFMDLPCSSCREPWQCLVTAEHCVAGLQSQLRVGAGSGVLLWVQPW